MMCVWGGEYDDDYECVWLRGYDDDCVCGGGGGMMSVCRICV